MMSVRKLLLLSLTICLSLTALEASAVCIYNTSGYPVKFVQTHGHKKAMTAKLPPNTHSCRKWNHPTLNAKGTKNANLGFYVSYYNKPLEKSKSQQLREARTIFKLARKGLPVQPIMEPSAWEFVCKKYISPIKSLTITGRPGQWNCLINHRSDAMHTDLQDNINQQPALPLSTADCNKEYHQCAADARRCKGNNCPTVNQCQNEYDDCHAYLQSQAPQDTRAESTLIEPEVIYWGATASHNDAPYFSWDYDTAKAAESSALTYCRKQNPKSPNKCQLEISFQNCAAAAFPHHGNQIYWVEDTNLGKARREVDAYCREKSGDSCHISWSLCANGDGGPNKKLFFYGSIAKPKKGKTPPVLLTNRHYANHARMHALRDCEVNSKDKCKEVVNFVTCAAYAETKNRAYFGWSRHEQLSQAKHIALKNCKKSSEENCQIVVSGCNRGF